MNDTPAFPSQEINQQYANEPIKNGMTLRDYFAAKAMTKIIREGQSISGSAVEIIARYSYVMADAMMKAREE